VVAGDRIAKAVGKVGDRLGGDIILLSSLEADSLQVVEAERLEAGVEVGAARGSAKRRTVRPDRILDRLAVDLDQDAQVAPIDHAIVVEHDLARVGHRHMDRMIGHGRGWIDLRHEAGVDQEVTGRGLLDDGVAAGVDPLERIGSMDVGRP
jgi:hypothetical protein